MEYQEVITPNFSSEDSVAHDRDAGIVIQVTGTGDLETILVYFEDERHGTKFSFYGSLLALDEGGNPTRHLAPDRRLCGYEGMGDIGKYVANSHLSLEDIRAYVLEGLRIIASSRLKIPKDQVVIRLTLAA
jgi:hypothetical protein